MYRNNFGYRTLWAMVLRAPEGGGDGGAGAAGAGAGGEGAGAGGTPAPVALPWGDKPDGEWKIGDKPWFETMPDGPTKELFQAKRYANPFLAADAYYGANKMISQNGQDIVAPKSDAPPEAWNEFYEKLGRPKTPDAYEFKFDESVKPDPKFLDFGKKLSHQLGLNPKQAQQLADNWNSFAGELNTGSQAETAAENDRQIEAVRTKHGADFDKTLAAGQRVVKSLGLDNALIDKVEASIGAGPIIELLCAIGMKSGESGFVGGGGGAANGGSEAQMTADQAAAKITELQGDATFQKAYTTANDPGHKDAVERMARLFGIAGDRVKL